VKSLTEHTSAQKYERIVFDDADPKRVGASSNAILFVVGSMQRRQGQKRQKDGKKMAKRWQKDGKKMEEHTKKKQKIETLWRGIEPRPPASCSFE
jgi:hypothetical protein